MFRRIFALATTKEGLVSSFGEWIEGVWQWIIQLQRRFMDWELNMQDDFNSILDEIFLEDSTANRLIWAPTTSGRFLCQSFGEKMNSHYPVVQIQKAMWCVPIPLKVQTFMWLFLHQRLPMRDQLCKLQLIKGRDQLCKLQLI